MLGPLGFWLTLRRHYTPIRLEDEGASSDVCFLPPSQANWNLTLFKLKVRFLYCLGEHIFMKALVN
jgi:hypothetical protein